MRKTNLFGATILALSTSALSLTAMAQPAPATAPAAPMAAPAPEAAPTPAPAAPDASAPAATAPDASAPAKPMTTKKHMTHKTMHGHGKLVATKAGDKAVDDLNSASLDSAKSGKPFTAPATPSDAKKEAHSGESGASTKHHMMHKAKKMAKPADTASAPADTSSTPPADTSGK